MRSSLHSASVSASASRHSTSKYGQPTSLARYADKVKLIVNVASRCGLTPQYAKLEELRPIAEKHKASIAQAVIAWTFSQPGVTCVLCGARDESQARENAAAGNIELSAEEIETMSRTMQG